MSHGRDWESMDVKVTRRHVDGEEEVHVAFTIEIDAEMTEDEMIQAAVAAMRRAARVTNTAIATDSDDPEIIDPAD